MHLFSGRVEDKERPEAENLIQLPLTIAIGFVGQRSLPDEATPRTLILSYLREVVGTTRGIAYGVSALHAGADLLFAEACIGLGIPLQVLLPMTSAEFLSSFNPSVGVRAKRVLEEATSIETITVQDSMENAYYECGIEAVQRSSLLVALWSGEQSGGKDDVGEIVSFARQSGKPVARIHSEPWTVEPPRKEHSLVGDSELAFLNNLPNCDVSRGDESPTRIAEQWFKKIDANASKLAPQVRRAASIPIVYTALAAMLSGAAWKSSGGMLWIVASAALGITAAALPIALGLDRRQAVWARTRTAAEVCRSLLAVWDAPFQSEVFGPEIGSELAGMLTSMHLLRMQASASRRRVTLEEFKAHYRKNRILDQIEYYSRHARKAENEAQRYRLVTFVLIGAAVLLALCWICGVLGIPGLHTVLRGRWFGLSLSALFQGATIVGALQMVNDSRRRQRRYRELSNWLTRWARQFEALRTWPSVLKVVVQVEKALMIELLEWKSLAKNTKLPRK